MSLGFKCYVRPNGAAESIAVVLYFQPASCVIVVHLDEYPSVLLGEGQANSISLEPELPDNPVEFVLELQAAHLPSLGFPVQPPKHELPGSDGFPCCQPWVCVRWRVDEGIRVRTWGLVRDSVGVCLCFGWEFLHVGIYFFFDVSDKSFHIEGQFIKLGDYRIPNHLVNRRFLHFLHHLTLDGGMSRVRHLWLVRLGGRVGGVFLGRFWLPLRRGRPRS